MNLVKHIHRFSVWILAVWNINMWLIGTAFGQISASGVASFYHDSLEGNRTANGEIFNQNRFTAAHKTLPFDTWVMLTDRSGTDDVVRVNDRLPATSSRMIDLTTLAARQLDMIQQGLKTVHLQVITSQDAWKWYLENGYFYLVRGLIFP